MSTDRELLELAAKAAKLILGEFKGRIVRYESDGQPVYWNPLQFDDDALRLAVKLGICIGPNFDNDMAVADGGEFSQHHCTELFESDKYAATRRAIVRVAAEIGKAMP